MVVHLLPTDTVYGIGADTPQRFNGTASVALGGAAILTASSRQHSVAL